MVAEVVFMLADGVQRKQGPIASNLTPNSGGRARTPISTIIRFSRATSNMEMVREGRGIQDLFTNSQGRFLFYKRDWRRYIVTRTLAGKLKKLARQRRRRLDPTLLNGSTINPVTDIPGFETGEQPCVDIYLLAAFLDLFVSFIWFFLVAHRKQENNPAQGLFFKHLPQ